MKKLIQVDGQWVDPNRVVSVETESPTVVVVTTRDRSKLVFGRMNRKETEQLRDDIANQVNQSRD